MLVAGTAAIAANIGILNAADSSAIGDLAATDELLPAPGTDADTAPVTVAGFETPTTTSASAMPAAGVAQQYDIADTATVWVLATRSGIALDHVVAEPGWTPALSQSDLRSLRVDFTSGDRTIVFTAALGDDGLVVADVTEPTTVVAATSAAATAPNATGTVPTVADHHDDDQADDGTQDDDGDHYDDESHDEHEGADDDD